MPIVLERAIVPPFDGDTAAAVLDVHAGGLLLAEQLNPATIHELNLDASRPDGYRRAWSHIERAQTPGSLQPPAEHLESSRELLLPLASSERNINLLAQLTLEYLPAFEDRAAAKELSASRIERVQIGVASLLFDHMYDEHRSGAYAEGLALLLFARYARGRQRPNTLAWPTSPREESSPYAQYNHDLYVILGKTKIPVQVKRQSATYDRAAGKRHPSILRLPMIEGLADARDWLEDSEDGSHTATDILQRAGELAIHEIAGLPLNTNDVRFLNRASQNIIHATYTHRRFTYRRSPPAAVPVPA